MIRACCSTSSNCCGRYSLFWVLLHQQRPKPCSFTYVNKRTFISRSISHRNSGIAVGIHTCSTSLSQSLSSQEKQVSISNRSKYNNKKYLFSSIATATTADLEKDNDNCSGKTISNTIAFNLADIGEGIKEVELLQWFVEVGDTVRQFDRICEVQSDKATVEITSRYDGKIDKLQGRRGDMIQVGNPLLYITTTTINSTDKKNTTNNTTKETKHMTTPTTSETPAAITTAGSMLHNLDQSEEHIPVPNIPPPPITTVNTTRNENCKFLASPAVRKLGKENNLDLSTITGTGPNGRVLKHDVLTFLRRQQQQQQPNQQHILNSASPNLKVDENQHDDTISTLKGYNRLMVKTMTESLRIPHMLYSDEINVHQLLLLREQINQTLQQQQQQRAEQGNDSNINGTITTRTQPTKLSALAFILKAVSLSLLEHPILNSTWSNIDEYEFAIKESHNIGVAMDTPRGLIVPVVQNVQTLSLREIQLEIDRLKVGAAHNKLSTMDLKGGTFSISNIGSLGGGTYMKPLIVSPQVGIGAVGSIQYLPRFKPQVIQEYKRSIKHQNNNSHTTTATTSIENVDIVPILNISWSADHRLVDGATLAKFSNTWKTYMESPNLMLSHLK